MIQLLLQRIMAVCLLFIVPVLGAFTKLRKGSVRFVMPACPSVRMSVRKNSASWTDIHEI